MEAFILGNLPTPKRQALFPLGNVPARELTTIAIQWRILVACISVGEILLYISSNGELIFFRWAAIIKLKVLEKVDLKSRFF